MTKPVGKRRYPDVPQQPSYPALEQETLAYWDVDGTFAASLAATEGGPEFVFNDGPPFANGLPHYGHLLTGYVKDAIPRFETMRGSRVERRFGWDCHGLPAEIEAERELGVSGRGPITAFGIDRFNDYCRTAVLRYAHAWEDYVRRQARWVDFEHAYKTMDLSFMESVIWAFAQLYRKGLVYESYRVLPYCWECETPLSNAETRQDDAYRERIDPAITVSFELSALPDARRPSEQRAKVLVWTTTPWTLPSNLALAIGPSIQYSVLEHNGEIVIVGADRLADYTEELGGDEVLETISGAELVGRSYAPLFPYFASTESAFVVLDADFVTVDEGTGVVHLAPGFGEDDQQACEANGIPVICPVDDRGRFDERVPDLFGIQVFEANEPVIDRLTADGVLLRREEYAHSYPHCWRTDTPLIYRAVSSYFVEVTAVKARMLELNQEITWVPEHVRDGSFGRWLEGARDWSISRNRFWGTPIPVWKSDDPAYPRIDVYASLDELEADFGVRPDDLHRPTIDELVRPNPDDPTGQSMMRRITDVLDCWFDSGSMPFAQIHYPFENVDRFEKDFPADFICEYIGQTRGWFYTMHVLSTALFDRPAFVSCVSHGVLLGNDGRKLSKRFKNFPDPEEFFDTFGADTMRWYLLSSPVLRGQDVIIEEQAMSEPVRQVLNPIWNSWKFLSLYGGTDQVVGEIRTDQQGVLDCYILAKCEELARGVTARLEDYDLAGACGLVVRFLDALTNWYVRRSRERFWRPWTGDSGLDADKRDAYDTLHTVLESLCRLCAPLLPLLTEQVYRGLTGARSVHLAKWPAPGELPVDAELVETMDLVREVCSAAHSIRKAEHRRTRLPLASLAFHAPGAERLAPFCDLIAEEVNVKRVELSTSVDAHVSRALTVVPAALGPRLGVRTQSVIAAVKSGDWRELVDGRIEAAGVILEPGEFTLRLVPEQPDRARVLPESGGVVVLDLEPSSELEAEGVANDVVRYVQQARKDAGLQVTDRIDLAIVGPASVLAVLEIFGEQLRTQTLATSLTLLDEAVAEPDHAGLRRYELPDGRVIGIGIERAEQEGRASG